MRVSLYILILSLLCINLYGQNIRTLKNELTISSDSGKVEIYNTLGDTYQRINLDSSIYFYSMAILFANKSSHGAGLIHSLGGHGFSHQKKGDQEKAAYYFKQVLHKADSLKYNLTERTSFLMAIVMSLKNIAPLEATRWANEALIAFKREGDENGQMNCYSLLGEIYANRDNSTSAIENYSLAIELARKLDMQEILGNNFLYLGSLYWELNNEAKALEYFYQAIDIGDSNKIYEISANAKLKVANIYLEQKKLLQAISLFTQVLNYYQSVGDEEMQKQLNYSIGLAMTEKGDPQNALMYFFKSYELSKKLGDKVMMAKNFNERATCYLMLNKIDLANQNTNWAWALASKEGFTEEMMNACLLFSEISTKEKKYISALTYYKRYASYRDKLFEEQKIAELESIEFTYKSRENELERIFQEKERAAQIQVQKTQKSGELAVQEKNNEVSQLNAKNDKLKNNTLIGSMILLLLFSLGTMIAYKNKLDDNKILIGQRDEIIKQKEDVLRKNKRLIELNEEKDSLVNMVAHDLRSPLDQIKGLVSVINMNVHSEEKSQEYLEMITYAAERMRKLIGRTLNIRNIDKQDIDPKNEIFDLSKLVDDVINSFVELANRKNLTIHSELQRNGCMVKADVNYMIQIMENLISNAIKFSPRGKSIRVKVGKMNQLVRIEVIDQGPGIRKEDMERLFKKFQRLSARPTGDEDSTGLGLSIVKKFADSMGGKVRCESVFGDGAKFIVEFQAYENQES